jgi:hypothetical protein
MVLRSLSEEVDPVMSMQEVLSSMSSFMVRNAPGIFKK